MEQIPTTDADIFRNLINKYGDPAVDFVRKDSDIFIKAGVFALFAANFDKVMEGGRDVLIKLVETGINETGEVIKETTKETVKTLGSTRLFLLITLLCIIYLTYKYIKTRRKE
ncbi:MAG: hypothetical protein HQK76_19240 [Desulfobacterales bacterium]|nr:hypothetical protein [Desulfobacterales bacterium]